MSNINKDPFAFDGMADAEVEKRMKVCTFIPLCSCEIKSNA
jgi:hypothetical protein